MAAELDALRSRAQSAEERCEGLMSEAQKARDQAAAAQEAATAADSKARTDMKVSLTATCLAVNLHLPHPSYYGHGWHTRHNRRATGFHSSGAGCLMKEGGEHCKH